MERFFEKHQLRLAQTSVTFVRSLMTTINWNARLIGIKGARGVGKTTLMLQRILMQKLDKTQSALYLSLDNIWFSENKLSTLVDYFVKRGGKFLFLDEVHRYPSWSQEIKNIYDDYPDLHIVFTGSSMLEILNARADLSRRAITYNMQGLSYREFLNLKYQTTIQEYTLDEVLHNHIEISGEINSQIKPLQYFSEYLQIGYYPFFMEEEDLFFMRLEEVVNMVLEIELPQLRNVDVAYIGKLKQLLQVVTESVPFVPNISKLSDKMGISRETLSTYLHFMNEAHILFSIYKQGKGISRLQKPDKLYLENTSLMYALQGKNADMGNVRETFFASQLRNGHQLTLPEYGDFMVDGSKLFEIGGKNKTKKQVAISPDAWICADDIEYGFDRKIPLWQFGLLY